MENNNRLIIARILAALAVLFSISQCVGFSAADADSPPYGCATGLIGPGISWFFSFIIAACCVAFWLKTEMKNCDSENSNIKGIAIVIAIGLVIVSPFILVSRCHSSPNSYHKYHNVTPLEEIYEENIDSLNDVMPVGEETNGDSI